MKAQEIRIIKSALSTRIGWSWPVVLLRALARKQAILNKTRWSNSEGAESAFVERLVVAPPFTRSFAAE